MGTCRSDNPDGYHIALCRVRSARVMGADSVDAESGGSDFDEAIVVPSRTLHRLSRLSNAHSTVDRSDERSREPTPATGVRGAVPETSSRRSPGPAASASPRSTPAAVLLVPGCIGLPRLPTERPLEPAGRVQPVWDGQRRSEWRVPNPPLVDPARVQPSPGEPTSETGRRPIQNRECRRPALELFRATSSSSSSNRWFGVFKSLLDFVRPPTAVRATATSSTESVPATATGDRVLATRILRRSTLVGRLSPRSFNSLGRPDDSRPSSRCRSILLSPQSVRPDDVFGTRNGFDVDLSLLAALDLLDLFPPLLLP